MAQNKTRASLPAFVHALIYSLPFLLLVSSAHSPLAAWMVIFVTHFLIDRFRLARYVVWAKNFLGPKCTWAIELGPHEFYVGPARTPPFKYCQATGYPPDRAPWLAVWLLIIADNTMHLAINYAALRWL